MLEIFENAIKLDENKTIAEINDIAKRIEPDEVYFNDDLIKDLRNLINDGQINIGNCGYIIDSLKYFGQIFLNLILDVNFFEKMQYRITYASRVDCVIPNWRTHLTESGYIEDGLFLVLNKEKYNRDECLNVVCRTSVYIKELFEILEIYAKNKSNVFEFKDAAQLRYDNAQINLLSEEELREKIKCYICDNKIDFKDWVCTVCDESQEHNSFIIKYHDILKSKLGLPSTFSRRNLVVNKTDDHPVANNVEPIPMDSNTWSCTGCTYLNTFDKLNCDVCERRR